jgi:hypothetical protein
MGSQSVEGSNALDRTSPIEKKGQPFVVPTIDLLGASDSTTMGDPPYINGNILSSNVLIVGMPER